MTTKVKTLIALVPVLAVVSAAAVARRALPPPQTSTVSAAAAQALKDAEQGNADAMEYLGGLYYNGDGVVRDPEEGILWLRRSADAGSAAGQRTLGALYETGVPGLLLKDEAQATVWLEKAAAQRLVTAQMLLVGKYRLGTSKNLPRAWMWCAIAESLLEGPDREYLVTLRTQLESEMTPRELAEGQRLATKWLAASSGA